MSDEPDKAAAGVSVSKTLVGQRDKNQRCGQIWGL